MHEITMQRLVSALGIVVVAIIISQIVLSPLWHFLGLHVPGEPGIKIDYTQPVDSIFYIRNAQYGYDWETNAPISTWFHPLLAWIMRFFPDTIPFNWRLWFISLIAAFGSLILLQLYLKEISDFSEGNQLYMILILPGGISIATGNAEIPCLFFVLLLLLSVVQEWPFYHPIIWGALAILTKPNALYSIPILVIYIVDFALCRNGRGFCNGVLGILSITAVWLFWISYVDLMVGYKGAYWDAREVGSTVPRLLEMTSFVKRAILIMQFSSDAGEKLKFASSIFIPLTHIWLLVAIRFKMQVHRIALLVGILAMVFVTFAINNPNKVIVYGITFPGQLVGQLARA